MHIAWLTTQSYFIIRSGGVVGARSTKVHPFKAVSDSIGDLQGDVVHAHFVYSQKFTHR